EEVAQEVFTMIWEKARIYDPQRGKPLTWAITMARNKAIDKLRSLRRRYRLNDEMERLGVINMTDGSEPWAGMVEVEDGEAVRRGLERLNLKQRQVLEMAFFGGMTQVEIASKLGEPLGTIKARIRRALIKLRQIVEIERKKDKKVRNK
ncbi:MAG: sigma-70 family RNA polymerase sigma factor, partial [Chthoniobacterales bacterium]|nr:sigma-70 family RNA polymerase sigma factor [Chthoniobacterales bacterium]